MVQPKKVFYPRHDEERKLILIPAMWKELLDYCAASAAESGVAGSLEYDWTTDEVIYNLRIREMDEQLFPVLKGATEIWIITRGGKES